MEVAHADNAVREEWGLFVGRLTVEKGIQTLLEAVRRVEGATIKVVGTGPLEDALKASATREPLSTRIELLGSLSYQETTSLIGRARFLVVPSECYETFGRVAVEAFACGTPVIASRLGALEELVDQGVTGLQFRAGDPTDLADAIAWALDNTTEMAEMGWRGRAVYESRYAPGAAFEALMDIYTRSIAQRSN